MNRFFIFLLSAFLVWFTVFIYNFLHFTCSIEEYLLVCILFRQIYFDILIETVDWNSDDSDDDELDAEEDFDEND
jgi:hypothetical protein